MAQGTWVFAEWMASLPSYLFSCLPVFPPTSVSLCFSLPSVAFFFLTLVSHLHVSFWVCLSLSHPHLHPLPGPGTCNTFVLWLHKKEHGISQAGYHYPLLSSSSVLA